MTNEQKAKSIADQCKPCTADFYSGLYQGVLLTLNSETVNIERNDVFWERIICNPDGTVNKEQVLKELADFSHVLKQVRLVYGHITDSILSKPMYYAQTVIEKADECYREMYLRMFREFLVEMVEDQIIDSKTHHSLLLNIKIHF